MRAHVERQVNQEMAEKHGLDLDLGTHPDDDDEWDDDEEDEWDEEEAADVPPMPMEAL